MGGGGVEYLREERESFRGKEKVNIRKGGRGRRKSLLCWRSEEGRENLRGKVEGLHGEL